MKKFLLSLIVMVLSVLSAHADWEKTTSIAVGDVVVLAYDDENVSKELSEVTSSGTTIGVVADYKTSPVGTYPLTVVAGSTEGSFAFKTSEDTYLAWSSGNSLKTIDEVTDASSWTVSFTEAGAADIYNVGTSARKLQYNTRSPRFACYGNADQKTPYLWKQVAEGSLLAPSITPSSGTFFETQTVTISAEDGATIHYTLDGTDPTAESAVYTDALSISETTTVKAIAVKDDKTSSVASTTITFGPVYDSFAAANAAATADKVTARLTFTEALVLYVNGQNAYIQDATGAMMLYGTSTLKAGDKISGYVEGELYLYNGLPELANFTLNAETVSSDNEVVPTVVDAAALAENPQAFVSQYVQVSPAKFAEDKEVSTVTNVNFTVGETALILRNNFKVEFSVEAAKEYTVAGIVTIYKGNLQLYPLAASDIAEIVPPEPVVTAVVNGDFSEGAVADNHICTYAKDMETNATTYSNMLEVEGWTAVNNGDGRAAGTMAYGSGKWIGGTGFNVPEFNPAGLNRGAALGVVAVWSADAQYTQATTFAPGYYVLTARINNVGGETATASNFFGVHVGETSYFAENKTYPVNQWTRENVLFQVEEEAEGYFSLGYKATNAGNAAQQHLFYDEVVVKAFESEEARTAYLTDLATADEADAAVYAFVEARFAKTAAIDALAPVGDGLFEYSQTAIDDAKAAVATAENIEAVEAVAMPVATAPDAEKQYTLKLKDGGMYMSINEGIKLAEEEYPFQLEAVEGGYAIKNGESYVAFTGTGNNTWTMNATAEPYAWTINSLGDGYYTIAKATKNTEYIGVDNTTAGSSCYANKSVGDKSLWALAEAMVYGVKVAEAENGSVEANPTEGYVGTKITLTVNPDEGYQLDELTVTYGDGQVVEVSEENTFVMPADNVTIIPSFKQIPEIVAAYGEIPTEETTFGADDDKSIDIATDYFTIAQAQDTIKVTVAGVGEEAQIAIYNKNDVAIDGLTQNVAAEQTEVDFILTEEQITAILGAGDESTARGAFKAAALREYIHVKGKNLTVNKIELTQYVEPAVEPAIAEGTYYMYNTAAQGYLVGANEWGTQASMNAVSGITVDLALLEDGKYTISTATSYGNGKFLGTGGYVDQDAYGWTIAKVDGQEGVYTIAHADKGYLQSQDGSTILNFNETLTDAAYWQFPTKADLEARFAGASEENPADATFYIQNPNFSRNASHSQWTGGATSTGGDFKWGAGNQGNFNAQMWNGTFAIETSVADVPNGKYRMYIQGFYRDGTGANVAENYRDVTLRAKYALNGVEKSLMSIADEGENPNVTGETYGEFKFPNSQSQASTCFDAGLYENQPVVAEVTNHTLNIKIYSIQSVNNDWAVWDNIRLQYIGALDLTAFIQGLADAVAAAQAVEGTVPAAVYEGLAAVVTEQNKEYATADEYEAAIAAITEATNAAKAVQTIYAEYPVMKAKVQALTAQEVYTDEGNTATTALNDAIGVIDGKVENATNVETIQSCIDEVKAAGLTFVSSVTLTGMFDLTDAYIVNATPNTSVDGWTVAGGSASFQSNCGEFWNASGASIKQTIAGLPVGYYTLTAVALTRTDMVATLSANENAVNVVTVASSEVNDRAQANTWFNNGNGINNLEFHLEEAGNVEIGLTADNTTGDHWMVWRSFSLKYAGTDPLAGVKALYREAIAAVYEAIMEDAYQNILGSGVETNNLRNALPQDEPTTREGYEAAIEAINTAFAAWKASAPSYDQLMNALNVAQLFGVDVDAELETIGEDESYSAAKAVEDAVKYKMQVADIVTENYTANVSAKLGEWTDNNIGENHGQHYDGTSESTYMEQKDGWGGSSWDASRTQTVTLPKGAYVLKVAARSSSAANAYVSITVGETETQVPFPNKNDAGFGIDTEGNLTFAADANYANNGNGRGWEWIFVPFTLAEDGDATITFAGSATSTLQWMSFTAWDLLQNPTTTGINGIRNNSELFKNADVYDLSGRKVQNPTRGLYIVNGRKVVIK